MANSEAKFSAEVRGDLAEVYKDFIHVNLLPDMRRSLKKPYDSYFCYKGMFCAIEFKRVDGHTFNTENKIRPHQWDKLEEVNNSGSVGVFVICFNDYKTSFIIKPKALKIIEAERGVSIKHDFFLPHLHVDNLIQMDRKKIEGYTRWEVERLIDAAERF